MRLKKFISTILMVSFLFSITAGPMGCGGRGGGGEGPLVEGAEPAISGGPYARIAGFIGAGIANWAIGEGMGWLLSLTGVDKDKQTPQMLSRMDMMNTELNYIIGQLAVIEQQLQEILKAIQVAENAIINNNDNLNIANDLKVIDNQYDNLKYFTKEIMGTAQGKASAQTMVNEILTGSDNIDQKLFNVYAGVMGTTPGLNEGAMSAWTTTLIDKVGTQNLLSLYKSLEYYFGALLNTQAKGLTLMVEALHQRDNPVAAAVVQPRYFPGTAQQYLDGKFTPWMQDEVEEFLRCVDRLVVASLDLRTDTVQQVQLMTDDVKEIYRRADFLAAQVSSRHSFGLNVRIIGEPDSVQAYIQANITSVADLIMKVVPVGLKPNQKNVRLTPVEVWNNWPGGYTRAYMQWNWKEGNMQRGSYKGWYAFNSATEVAVAKLNMGVMTGHYDVWVKAPNETLSASVTSAWYDENMQTPTDSSQTKNVYGHAVIPIRHRPNWNWNWGWTYQKADPRVRTDAGAGHSANNINPYAGVLAQMLTDNTSWLYTSAQADVKAGLVLPVVNEMSSKQLQRVTCVLEVLCSKDGAIAAGVLDYVWAGWSGDGAQNPGANFYWSAIAGDFNIQGVPNSNVVYNGQSELDIYVQISDKLVGYYLSFKRIAFEVNHAYLFF